jgi:DNA-binding CsgD family transcriptional regulator
MKLTAQENKIRNLRILGLDYDQISERLFISKNTIHVHIKNINKKTTSERH